MWWDEPEFVVDSPSPVAVAAADRVAYIVAVGTAVVVVVGKERGLADMPRRRCSEGGWTRELALYGQ